MRNYTHSVVFIKNEKDEILLGIHRRGPFVGKLNGFGGKLEPGETLVESAYREVQEETGLEIINYQHVANIYSALGEKQLLIAVLLCNNWSGTPLSETAEMQDIQWYRQNDIPLEQMLPDNQQWLLRVLNGEELTIELSFGDDLKLSECKISELQKSSI